MSRIHEYRFSELSKTQLLRILTLREAVFVVEQECPYPEIDGRDDEPSTRHIWIEQGGAICTYLRLLRDPEDLRIGRVVTAPNYRGQGLSAELMDYVLATTQGPWVLDAQERLEPWYAKFGFKVTGPSFLDFDLPHVPMRRLLDAD